MTRRICACAPTVAVLVRRAASSVEPTRALEPPSRPHVNGWALRARTVACNCAASSQNAAVVDQQQKEADGVRARLSGSDLAAWEAAVSELSNVMDGVDAEAVEKLVEKAFGWGAQTFWRGSKVCLRHQQCIDDD